MTANKNQQTNNTEDFGDFLNSFVTEEIVENDEIIEESLQSHEEKLVSAKSFIYKCIKANKITKENALKAIAIFENANKKGMNLTIQCIVTDGNLLIENHKPSLTPKQAPQSKNDRSPIPFLQKKWAQEKIGNKIQPDPLTETTPNSRSFPNVKIPFLKDKIQQLQAATSPTQETQSGSANPTVEKVKLKNKKLPTHFFNKGTPSEVSEPTEPEKVKLKKNKIPMNFFNKQEGGEAEGVMAQPITPTTDSNAEKVINFDEMEFVPPSQPTGANETKEKTKNKKNKIPMQFFDDNKDDNSDTTTAPPIPQTPSEPMISVAQHEQLMEEQKQVFEVIKDYYEEQITANVEQNSRVTLNHNEKRTLENLKAEYEKKLQEKIDNYTNRYGEKHKRNLNNVKAHYEKQIEEKFHLLTEKHNNALKAVKQEYEKQIDDKIAEYNDRQKNEQNQTMDAVKALKQMRESYQIQMEEQTKYNEKKLEELKTGYEKKINELEKTIESLKK